MRLFMAFVLVLFLTGCSRVIQVRTDINIPELNSSEYHDSYYIDGWKSLKAGDPKQAIEYFEKSNLEDDKLYVGFGYAFLAQNKLNLARRNFKLALELNPDSLNAELGLASMYELMKDKENAFKIYSRLLIKYPDNIWIKVRYEYIKSTQTEYFLRKAEAFKIENRDKKYIQSLENASKYSPEIIDLKLKIADFYYKAGEYEKSSLYYEEILEKFPNKEDILFKLAENYERMKKIDSAIIVYKRLAELKPGDINITNKINDLKVKFYEIKLPLKFKNIFFKDDISREDLAALIGYYFDKYLTVEKTPLIITDITGSYAKDYIIKLCTLNIMKLRADHSFGRFKNIKITRGDFAVVIHSLMMYLENYGLDIRFTPYENIVEPPDISPLHKNYKIIKFLINSQIMRLDAENKFNSTLNISPAEAFTSIKKILNSIEQ